MKKRGMRSAMAGAARGLWPLVLGVGSAMAQLGPPSATVATLLEHERSATEHRGLYTYVSKERSERTGGHWWTERVAETKLGKVRFLVAEDGVPLSAAREGQERGRLAAIVADPAGFAKKEEALKNDELKAKRMLELLPRAFLFENPRMEGPFERIDYKPNPAYEPRNLEERVLHSMVGSMWVDPTTVRLARLGGRLPEDVSIGFGLLATIHAGSRFLTERAPQASGEWKTTLVDTDINGRAIFFKAISRQQHSEHGDFREISPDTSVAQAVAIAEQ